MDGEEADGERVAVDVAGDWLEPNMADGEGTEHGPENLKALDPWCSRAGGSSAVAVAAPVPEAGASTGLLLHPSGSLRHTSLGVYPTGKLLWFPRAFCT